MTALTQVRSLGDMWAYMNSTLIPGLSYEGTRYTLDRANVLVGAARIRQLRARPGLPEWYSTRVCGGYLDLSVFFVRVPIPPTKHVLVFCQLHVSNHQVYKYNA